jgi:hypothetical protein
MAIEAKEIEKLEFADLQELLDNRVPESKVLEYKRTLKFGDKEKREFLADVSSFANTAGGHMIIGVHEEGGVPADFPGIELENPDAEALKLTSLIRDGIEPRIYGVSIRNIPLGDSKYVTLIRIPKSWIAPHVVTFNQHWRFYARHSCGKYPLDVPELRQAFIMSGDIAERIKRFRLERLNLIMNGEAPTQIVAGHKVVLHIIPLSAFTIGNSLDLTNVNNRMLNLTPMGTEGGFQRFNLDGYLTFGGAIKYDETDTYFQLFRNGIAEYVSNIYEIDRKLIYFAEYERFIMMSVNKMLTVYQSYGVTPPVYLFVSLIGVKNHVISNSRVGIPSFNPRHIDRDVVTIPEVVINDFSTDIDITLKPAFDAVWNSSGVNKCPNYDENGRWKSN